MQSSCGKAVFRTPAEKTVLLYVVSKDDQLADKVRQLGVEAVAVPSAKKLIAYTEEFWLPGGLCQLVVKLSRFTCTSDYCSCSLVVWTKEAAGVLKRAPAASRRMLAQGKNVTCVDSERLDLLEDLVCCCAILPCHRFFE